MARGWCGAAAVLGALVLLAGTVERRLHGDVKNPFPMTSSFTKLQYDLPKVLEVLARKNYNCTMERRELQMKMRSLKTTCKSSSGIAEAELSKIKQEGPSSEAGKCFLGCMMEGMDIIEGGAFAKDRADHLVSTVYAEGAKRRSARDAVRACSEEVTTTDKCETGGLIFQCFQRHRVGLFGPGGA